MDDFFFLIILFMVLGVAGSIIRFVLFIKTAKNFISAAQRDLDRLMPNIEQLIREYSNLPPAQKRKQQMQFMNMMMQANNQMRNLQDLNRQRYDVRMGELQGMAASAGLDWTPPSF